MSSIQRLSIYITFIEKEGPFLKLWGQTDKTKAIFVEQFLLEAAPQFDLGLGRVTIEQLIPGTLVCAKYKDNKYYRAKILNIFVREGFVEVNFVDFGNKETVACEEIRSFQSFLSAVSSIPPLAVGFIFAEAHCVGGGEWNDLIFESIAKELKYREFQCTLLAQATQHYLVRLSIEETDISSLFIQRSWMQSISLQAQQAVLLSMSMLKQSNPQPQETNSIPSGINTYKACTLEPGQQYPVYVSYVNDGPCRFSVQLKKTEDVLVMLMTEINSITLRVLEDTPIPGTICLARCQEDNNICRAVVTTEVDTQFRVFYVDFGNYEVLPADSLYQIPFKYVLPKVMAIRFSLAGVEKPTVTIDMQKAFKKFVDNRLLHMRVLPSPTRTALPKCELWDPETNTSALDVVMNVAKHSYPEPLALTRGFSQPVKVSFVYSCNRFYVQLTNKENELMSMMENLQELCQSNKFLDPSSIKPPQPCCALFTSDGLWYRSQVVEVIGNDVKVRYIDYGNEEMIPKSELKDIDGEILTVLRPQAIECCLNGYQNMEADEVRDGLLEELILEGVFTMKVVDMCDKKALVDLFNESNYNVASLLLDKLAAANSQISPVLAVQAGNKLEHRKSYSQQREQNFGEKTHNTGREQKSWDKPNDRTDRNEKSWRQDGRDNRNLDTNKNENNETNSWRQNNKGFSPNSRIEKHNNENDSWDNNKGKSTNSWNTPATEDSWNDSNTQEKTSWGDNNDDNRNRRNNDYKSNRGGSNDRGGRGGFNNRDRGDRGGFKGDRGDFNNDRGGFKGDRDGFNNDRGGFKGDRDRRDRDRGDRGGFRNDRDDRGGDRYGARSRDGGFKQRDFKKEGSEIMSSSGSEKSYHRGPRTSSRSDRGGRGGANYTDRPRSSFKDQSSFGGGDSWETTTSAEDSWNVSSVTSNIDAAPVDATFTNYEMVGTESKVAISWFHNPGLFYCQPLNDKEQFKTMMEEIHDFYKSRKPEKVVQGSPAIGLFPEDNVLYRARVLDVTGNQYKVQYVDYGNVSTITKVWPIDKKFMNLPAQAIICCLNNVAPVGENWSDPDCYSGCFDKEEFDCKFVNKDEEKTFVELSHGSDDVAQLLVREGLAVSTALTVPDIEIPILLGQQFRAMVKSVNNLSDIILALECGLAVSCTMHNLENATKTFEEVLKGLLEQAVIVYVDNVLEDYRLEITLYDTQGSKHVIVEPDEGSYDTVDVPCPKLVLCSSINGYVTFVDETSVYILTDEASEQAGILLDQLFEAYDEKVHENTIIPEEGMIYAVHSEDGNWYRGKVISFDDEKALICFVDYGNSESVSFSELRELEAQFLDISILSLQVTVPTGTEGFVDKKVSAVIYYGESGWEGTLQILDSVNTETSLETAHIDSSDTGIATISVEKQEEVSGEQNEEATEAEVVKAEETATSIGTSVFVSHIDSPCDFYVQFNQNLDDIQHLQDELQEKVAEMEVLVNPAPGILCAAPYSLDQLWYRAEVLDADEDITTVRFVDFGNTDVIDNKTTQIKTLPPKLLSLAIYATRCSLKIEPLEEDWSPLAQSVFETLISEGELTAEFCNQDEKCTFIELYCNGINVKDALVKENLAKILTTTTETKQTGFVSHFNSPSEFWIQLESCVDELEWIAEQLSTAENFPELTDLTPGTLCAALFPDDQMWYRARILSNTVAGVELLFIDYGNSCTSTDLKQLPEDLIMTAPLAMKCSLQKNDSTSSWSPEAAAKFSEISADGQTIFTVKKISTGETSVVQLYLDDKDVTTMLLPTTEDGYVKTVETLENLSIEKDNGEIVENVALQPLDGQKLDVEDVREKFEELNEQGSTLFQIEFVDNKTIRLYLQGKDIRPLLGGFINPDLNEEQNSINEEEKSNQEDVLIKTTENADETEEIADGYQEKLQLEESPESLVTKTSEDNIQNEIKLTEGNIASQEDILNQSKHSEESFDEENVAPHEDALTQNHDLEEGTETENAVLHHGVVTESQDSKESFTHHEDVVTKSQDSEGRTGTESIASYEDIVTESQESQEKPEAEHIAPYEEILTQIQNSEENTAAENITSHKDIETKNQDSEERTLAENIAPQQDLLTESKDPEEKTGTEKTISHEELVNQSQDSEKSIASLEDIVTKSQDPEDKSETESTASHEEVVTQSQDAEERTVAENIAPQQDLLTESKDPEEKTGTEKTISREEVVNQSQDSEKSIDAHEGIVTNSQDSKERTVSESIAPHEEVVTKSHDPEEKSEAENIASREVVIQSQDSVESIAPLENLLIKSKHSEEETDTIASNEEHSAEKSGSEIIASHEDKNQESEEETVKQNIDSHKDITPKSEDSKQSFNIEDADFTEKKAEASEESVVNISEIKQTTTEEKMIKEEASKEESNLINSTEEELIEGEASVGELIERIASEELDHTEKESNNSDTQEDLENGLVSSDGSAFSLDDVIKEHVMIESLAVLHNISEEIEQGSTDTNNVKNKDPEKNVDNSIKSVPNVTGN